MNTEEQRVIKFRGKRVFDGQWVYGCLVNNLFYKRDTKKACCYIIPDETSSFEDGREDNYYYDSWDDVASWVDEFEVIQETVGQYTGLSDKNGTDIYEGDIVEGIGHKYIISFYKGSFSLIDEGEHYLLSTSAYGFLEVIGNIREHLHLLEK